MLAKLDFAMSAGCRQAAGLVSERLAFVRRRWGLSSVVGGGSDSVCILYAGAGVFVSARIQSCKQTLECAALLTQNK